MSKSITQLDTAGVQLCDTLKVFKDVYVTNQLNKNQSIQQYLCKTADIISIQKTNCIEVIQNFPNDLTFFKLLYLSLIHI